MISPHPIVVLDSSICRDTRWCARCAGPKLFLEIFECEGGRLICCQGCGEERMERFTRNISEGE